MVSPVTESPSLLFCVTGAVRLGGVVSATVQVKVTEPRTTPSSIPLTVTVKFCEAPALLDTAYGSIVPVIVPVFGSMLSPEGKPVALNVVSGSELVIGTGETVSPSLLF